MTRTTKLVLSGVIALVVCLTLLFTLLNAAHGDNPSLRDRNRIDHFTTTTEVPHG